MLVCLLTLSMMRREQTWGQQCVENDWHVCTGELCQDVTILGAMVALPQ